MAKILVTGGIGYNGSHSCVELLAEGFELVILDNFYNSNSTVLDKIQRITGCKPSFYKWDWRLSFHLNLPRKVKLTQ